MAAAVGREGPRARSTDVPGPEETASQLQGRASSQRSSLSPQISPGNTLKGTPRNDTHQLSGHPLVQSS